MEPVEDDLGAGVGQQQCHGTHERLPHVHGNSLDA
jgi:hypothetical protein